MNKNFITKWFIIFVGCFVLQTSLIPKISVWGVTPDILVIALFFFAMETDVLPALFVGFLLGLIQDLYSPAILGQNALAKTLLGFLAGMVNQRVMRTDLLIKSMLLFVAMIIHDSIFNLVYVSKGIGSIGVFFITLLRYTIPRALYSTIITFFIYLWSLFIKSSHPN
jgi:rod shape-determining protein MreD